MPRILMERSGELEVFVRVVQEGALSAAARSLSLTPSAVSKLVTRLENRLGARLLVRTTRALALTDEGEAYYRSGLRILQELNEADQAVGTGTLRGRLRVNASIPFGTMFVAPLVRSFLARHPQLCIELNLTDDIVDVVTARTDVAIRNGPLGESALVAKRLGHTRRVVCASPGYLERKGAPRTVAELAAHECLAFSFKHARSTWPFLGEGRRIDVPVRGNLQVNNGTTMRDMVVAGAGIGRLGRFHVEADIAAGRLVPILEELNPGDLELVHAVHVGGGNVPRRVRAFVEHMVEGCARSPLLR